MYNFVQAKFVKEGRVESIYINMHEAIWATVASVRSQVRPCKFMTYHSNNTMSQREVQKSGVQ